MMDDDFVRGQEMDDLLTRLISMAWNNPKAKRAHVEKVASDLRKAQAKAGARDRMTDCRRFIRASGRRG